MRECSSGYLSNILIVGKVLAGLSAQGQRPRAEHKFHTIHLLPNNIHAEMTVAWWTIFAVANYKVMDY